MNRKSIFRLSIGIVLASFFIWLVFERLSIKEMLYAFDNVNIGWILAATGAFFMSYYFRIVRWRLMLLHQNPELKWINCAGPLFVSVAANNLLPFRFGDIIRSFAFNKRLNIIPSVSVTTLLIERALDLVVVICILGFTIWFFNMNTYSVIGFGGLLIGSVGFIVLTILIYPNVMLLLINKFERQVSRFLPHLLDRIKKQTRPIYSLFVHLSKKNLMVKLIGWSVLTWIAEGFLFWFVALGMPSVRETKAAWLALTVGTLSTVIPSTPGFIGTFDYFTAQSMVLMGNELAASTAYALTVHAILWFPPTIIGGIYILLNPLNFNQITELPRHD